MVFDGCINRPMLLCEDHYKCKCPLCYTMAPGEVSGIATKCGARNKMLK